MTFSSVVFLILTFSASSTSQALTNQHLESLPVCQGSRNFESAQIEMPSTLMSSGDKTMFRLYEQSLTCPSIVHNVSLPLALNDEEVEDVEAKFESNGILKYDIGNYWKNEYCLESLSLTEAVVSICEINCTDPRSNKICVPKCCGWGKVLHFLNESNVTCGPPKESTVTWLPPLYHSTNPTRCLQSRDEGPDCVHKGLPEDVFHYQNTFHGCEENFNMDRVAYDDMPFAFTKNGSLHVYSGLTWPRTDYCIDSLYSEDENAEVKLHAAMVCTCESDDPYQEEKGRIDVVYVVVMFISAFFLCLTVIVYILIWDKQNIHGWTVFSLSVSMGLMLFFLGSARLIVMTQGRESVAGSSRCIFVGLSAHFLFLSTFSLLTCLSFDLWWTFRTLAPSIGKSKGIVRFRMYLAFSLGLPFIIVLVGYILDRSYLHLPKHKRPAGIVLPEYGVDTCYIANRTAQGVYIFLPVALLLLANLLFFLTTMWIMFQYHQNTKKARKNAAKQKQTLYLFTKLFIVMGVTWTVEVIEYLSDYNRTEKDAQNCTIYRPPGYQWMVTDFFNIVQGILIFLIFVCKKSVMIHLSRKNSALRAIVAPIFLLPCCKINQLDLEAPSGRTNQSSVSMRTFTPRNAEASSSSG